MLLCFRTRITINSFSVMSALEQLPEEVLGEIIKYLDRNSLLQLMQTSRACYLKLTGPTNVNAFARIVGVRMVVLKR